MKQPRGRVRGRLLLIAISMLWNNQAFSAGILATGNDYILACRAFVSQKVAADIVEAIWAGQCIGAVRSMMEAGPFLDQRMRFCPPDHATIGQGANVILKYMADHPGQTDRDFFAVGVKAFQVWPCQHE